MGKNPRLVKSFARHGDIPRVTGHFQALAAGAGMVRLLPSRESMNDLLTHPSSGTLEGRVPEPGSTQGLAIDALEAGTTLIVHTANSAYRLVVLDPDERLVWMAGGMFPQPVSAYVHGASGSGSVLKTGWIGVGLRIELFVDGTRCVTSRVRSISRTH